MGGMFWPTNSEFVNASTWEAFNDSMQGCELGTSNNYTQGLAPQLHRWHAGQCGPLFPRALRVLAALQCGQALCVVAAAKSLSMRAAQFGGGAPLLAPDYRGRARWA